MAQSFTAVRSVFQSESRRRSVLVTGGAGRIGSFFAEHSHDKYQLRLMIQGSEDPAEIEKIRAFGETVQGELSEIEHLKQLCEGMDTVLHLAANPSPEGTWDSIVRDNIAGTYNLFVAAKAAGCRRVVYASSIHAVSGYPADVQVKTTDPVNPGDLYGVSKCFGEALARYMAEKEGLSSIAIRIGAFQPVDAARNPENLGMLDAFVSRRDLNQLIEKCIDTENLQFAVVHGVSDNRFKRMDISDTRELLGYQPQDDFTEENPRLKPLHLKEKVSTHGRGDKEQKSGLRKDLKKLRGK